MKVIAPRVVTDAVLASTNLAEATSVPYAATTTYAKGARARRVAPIFDPTALFAGGGVKGWWRDFSDLSKMWQDAAKTIPAAVDQPIGYVSDKSGNGNHWHQPTAAARPILRSDGTSYWAETNGTQGFRNAAVESLGAAMDFFWSLAPSADEVLVPSWVTTWPYPNEGSYVAIAAAGSAIASSSGIGGPATFVSGAAVATETGAALATALASNTASKVLEVRGADLSAWTGDGWGNYGGYGFGGKLFSTICVPSAVANANRIGIQDYMYRAGGKPPSEPDGVRIYESLQANNIGHALTDAAWWLDAGPTNRWAMFDGAVGSLSRGTGTISVTLKPDVAIDALAVLEVTAATVRVQISAGGASVYDQTKPTGSAPAALTFLGLPATADATVTVTIAGATGATLVTAGALLMGSLADLGLTEAGPSIGINDFSKRQTDDFGVTSVVERGWAKRMTIKSKIDTSAVADLQQRLTTLRALPSLWIGEEGFDSLIIYGFFKEFAIDLALDTISYCSLTIEGMTTASDLDSDTPAGLDALQAQVTNALDRIAVIQSDGYLSAGEKPDIIRQATDIANEYADIVTKAVTLGVSSIVYANAYTTLNAYLSGLTPTYTDTTTDTAVVAITFNARFADYYLARTALLNAITAKAATLATWAGTTGAGKPADNATRNDQAGNDIAAPNDPTLWGFFSGASISTAIVGRPRAQLYSNNARVEFSGLNSCRGGERIYYRYVVSSDGGTSETCNASYRYVRQDGSIGAVNLSADTARRLDQVADTVVQGSFVLPDTARSYCFYVERPSFTANSFFVDKPFSGPAQPGADITSQNQHSQSNVADIVVAADYQGTIVSGELPVTFSVRRLLGTTDVSAQTVYSIVSDAGSAVTINNAAGSDLRGNVSITTLAGNIDTLVITSTYLGVTLYQSVKVSKVNGPQPTGGGGGGGGAAGPPATSAGPFTPPGKNAYTTMATLAAVVVGSSGGVELAVSVTFYQQDGSSETEATNLVFKWQASVNGGAFADVMSDASGNSAQKYFQVEYPKGQKSYPGSLSSLYSHTGLTSGASVVYRVQTTGSPTTYGVSPVSGTISATPK